MFPNETTSTFQVTSEQFPLLFDYVSNVSYDTQEKTLSLTLPLLTKACRAMIMTPESLVDHAMLDAFKRKGGIARKLEFSGYLVSYIEPKSEHGKYGTKPIFISFGADNARTIIDNMASDDWASFCEVRQWLLKTV